MNAPSHSLGAAEQGCEAVDFSALHALLWKELARHHLSEHEMVILGHLNRLSFGISRPFAWIQHGTDLVELSGVPKNKIYGVLRRLESMGAIEREPVGDGWLVTLLPPSTNWPWIAGSRLKDAAAVRRANKVEAELMHATRNWPAQQELFAPPAEREFAQALAIERMRESLVQTHHDAVAVMLHGAACGEGITEFQVMDRNAPAKAECSVPFDRNAPAKAECSVPFGAFDPFAAFASLGKLKSEGRPPESERSKWFAGSRKGTRTGSETGGEGEPGPEKGPENAQTGPEKGPALLIASLSYSSLKEPLSNETYKADCAGPEMGPALRPDPVPDEKRHARELLEPLDPGASEDEMVRWLRYAMGEPVMDKFGGWWRNQIRAKRRVVLDVCYQLRLRLTDPKLKPLAYRGGWMRDQFNRIIREDAG